MRHVIYLVQRGINSNQVVSGKSGKNYGTAVYVPSRGGAVLRMTMEEYGAAREDIVGNTAPMQQWIPDIVPDIEAVPGRGKCGIPAGCRNDAEFVWDTYLYCRDHAPNNANPIDDKVVPLSERSPAPAPKTEEPPVAPPEHIEMPPPAVGGPGLTASYSGQPSVSITGPGASQVVDHEGMRFEFVEGAVRVGKTKLSTTLLETLGNGEPNRETWFRILKRSEDGMLLLERRLIVEKEPEPVIEVADELEKMPFKELQALAKERGMNTFQKGRVALADWVRGHPNKPDA